MGEENYYITATLATDPDRRIDALAFFIEEELHETATRLTALEASDGSIPDDDRANWNYEKGQLDMLRLLYGMIQQGRLRDARESRGCE